MSKPRTYRSSLIERTLQGGEQLTSSKNPALATRSNALPAEVAPRPGEAPAPQTVMHIEKTLGQLAGMPVKMPTSSIGLVAWWQSIGQRIKLNGHVKIGEKMVQQTDNIVRIMQNTLNTQQMYLELQDIFTQLQFDVEIKRLDGEMQLMQKRIEYEEMKRRFKAGLPPLPQIAEPVSSGSAEDVFAGRAEDDE